MNGTGMSHRLNTININKTQAHVRNIKYKNTVIAIATKNQVTVHKITKIALTSLKN
jgi:hypothetical protein